ncbi:MAG: magnesium transporter [Chlamydiales bacterium]|nr:magnesium transporter [Chlamydiales bacterium]
MKIDPSQRFSPKTLAQPVQNFLSTFQFAFTHEQTIGDILAKLNAREKRLQNVYFYVLDSDGFLIGIVTVQEVLYNKPETKLIDILDHEVLKIRNDEPLEKALKILAHHELLALPVVDAENRYLGIIDVVPQDEEHFHNTKRLHAKTMKEDIFQFIGFSIEQGKMASTWSEFRYRMPWLLCNLVGGLICVVIGEAFEETLRLFVILALFIPLVLSLSESVAVQSMTISLRFLHLKKIYWTQVLRRCNIEWKASLLLGLGNSILIAAFYFAWSTELMPIIAMAISITVSMIGAALFGALFPIVLHALKLDPKVAAGPVVLTMADIITVSIYYSLTTAFLL